MNQPQHDVDHTTEILVVITGHGSNPEQLRANQLVTLGRALHMAFGEGRAQMRIAPADAAADTIPLVYDHLADDMGNHDGHEQILTALATQPATVLAETGTEWTWWGWETAEGEVVPRPSGQSRFVDAPAGSHLLWREVHRR